MPAAGQHARYDDPERVQWRADHGPMIAYLNNFMGDSTFIRSVRESVRTYGWLTPAQAAAVERWMNNERATPDAAPVLQDATNMDAVNILNGDYTLNDGTEHLTYRLHTVRTGPLQDKRIIKRLMGDGTYKGFAFLTTTGHVKVWRRFADDERRNERYIVWAHTLLHILREQATPDAVQQISGDESAFLGGTANGQRWEVQVSTRCRVCNRPLTNPSSIDMGMGPECAGRMTDRTVAAQQHEPIEFVPPTAATPGITIDNMGVHIPGIEVTETDEQRRAREQAERTDAAIARDAAATVQQQRATMQRITSMRFGDEQMMRRWRALYDAMPYHVTRMMCTDCGRSDFESRRGLTSHRNNYCRPRQDRLARVERERQESLAGVRPASEVLRENAATRLRPMGGTSSAPPVTPVVNPSALGTRINGEVWAQ